ncbi:MAG: NAD(P)(+) transhydrogenase (Re/Si-specific) subunit beta [Clostridiales bacterium]|nr:NAD(P)(+) transhydrogenase (Re/Si-specific) subunit beta [Clostridiales bacterium]
MSDTLYYIISAVLSLGVLLGIRLMSNVKTAVLGNRLSALCMLLAIVATMARTDFTGSLTYIIGALLVGSVLSVYMAAKVRMIQMPQMVGLLNGLGGLASSLAAVLTVLTGSMLGKFELGTAGLALGIGALTLSGSLVAASKLHGIFPQKPIIFPAHSALTGFAALVLVVLMVLLPISAQSTHLMLCLLLSFVGLLFGWLFAIRVGGADMPITISLLNSSSGVAASIAGMALGDILLVSVGAIVGASGLLLTLIMCRAMNRRLSQVIFSSAGKQPEAVQKEVADAAGEPLIGETESTKETDTSAEAAQEEAPQKAAQESDLDSWLGEAQSVIVIPGYGMALSQAQELVKQFTDKLESLGKTVRFAIHPVAGRMPGHMNVLLAEVDIPYELLCEMDEINPDFPNTDLVIVIGANDVINPAANTAEGTPIYGMPILDAGKAKRLVICNFDTKPGYAGVDNPLYNPHESILLLLGDAKASIETLLSKL